MSKIFIATNRTFKYNVQRHGENPFGKSMTQPDMAFTVQELLERFTHGSMPAVVKEGTYQDDADFDNFDKTRDGAYDLADAVLEKEALNQMKAEREAKFQAKVKAKQELLKAEQAEFEHWKKSKKSEEKKEEVEKPTRSKKEKE